LSALLLCILAGSCDSGSTANRSISNGDYASENDEGDGGSDDDNDDDIPEPNMVCDEADFNIDWLPVRMMILQDMSGSMTDELAVGLTKWDVVRTTMLDTLKKYEGQGIEFGYDVFPDEPKWQDRRAGPPGLRPGERNRAHLQARDSDAAAEHQQLHPALVSAQGIHKAGLCARFHRRRR